MRLLYLYPEEWTGHRAREVHTLATVIALADAGIKLTLLVAGGVEKLKAQLAEEQASVRIESLSRSIGPIRSARIFELRFRSWLARQPVPFDAGFTIHHKGAALLQRNAIPYAYEAHEIFFKGQPRHRELEHAALKSAQWRIATSAALAEALAQIYDVPNDFLIAPNAGQAPLPQPVGDPDGPLVYAGSLADWKGLDVVVAAARAAQLPLRIVGGTEDEWRRFSTTHHTAGIEWRPRVSLDELPRALAGARAGLIPTDATAPSGTFSCPMKLFDYARCGLPVISTALPSLRSLEVGAWCVQVEPPTVAAWRAALENFRATAALGESAQAWSARHTWAERGRTIAARLTRA